MPEEFRASAQDGTYPRPQLVRPRWLDLSGEWDFAFDDDGTLDERTGLPDEFTRTIVVPYPPEAPLSGVGETGYHPVVWYRRRVRASELAGAGHSDGRALLLHFGAVDYRADVWIDGRHVAAHEGGHTPFTASVTGVGDEFEIIVRAEDDPHDLSQPRGKQDWEEAPHAIWYHRTTGIWQPVWIESVARRHVSRVAWRSDIEGAAVHLTLELDGTPAEGTTAKVTLRHGARQLAETVVALAGAREDVSLSIPLMRNGQGFYDLLWTPGRPTLIDARIEIVTPGEPGEPDASGPTASGSTASAPPASDASDVVWSYFGIRSVGTRAGRFLLNGFPYAIEGVLSQGYWPQSHLAAPSAAALKAEVELIKELGFTTARMHQKPEDPRFLYWADRLGLLLWAEMPSAYEFSDLAITRLTHEWAEIVRRDISHPSVVAWVPINESWAVHHIPVDARQQDLVRALFHLTKALDDTRPVISNDGWEHTQSDLYTIHDYENDHEVLRESYGTPDAAKRALDGIPPSGRVSFVGTDAEAAATASAPLVLSEFGGVGFTVDQGDGWSYRTVGTAADFDRHLAELFGAVRESTAFGGWVYTQLTDTVQEMNGLADENRVPKLPIARLRAIIRGEHESAG